MRLDEISAEDLDYGLQSMVATNIVEHSQVVLKSKEFAAFLSVALEDLNLPKDGATVKRLGMILWSVFVAGWSAQKREFRRTKALQ